VRHIAALGLVFAVGCTNLDLDPAPKIIHARFDPDASVIPMPTDVLRDAATLRLNLPNDTDKERAKLNATESEFYNYLETLDGWSSLMSASVEFTGAVPRSDIGGHYGASVALVFPSHSDGFGMAQIEARAAGLPIVASPCCGRVVDDQVTGLILPAVSAAGIVVRLDVAPPSSPGAAMASAGGRLLGQREAKTGSVRATNAIGRR